jgi:hypothetical protein
MSVASINEPSARAFKHLTPLMRAKMNAADGVVVNRCPFGCADDQLDQHGYCHHLVGFTVPGDKTRMEGMVERPVSKLKSDPTSEHYDPEAKPERYTSYRQTGPVPAGAILDEITAGQSCRVYVKNPAELNQPTQPVKTGKAG